MNGEPQSRCQGITRSGARCRNNALPGERYCRTHLWQGRITDTSRLEFWALVVAILALLVGIIDAGTGVIGILPSFRHQVTQMPQPTATPLAFSPAADDEVLIVVAQLDDRSGGKYSGIDPAQRIYNTIEDEAKDQPQTVRIELLREVVADSHQARAKLEVYRATLLVWGWYDAIGTQPIVEINKDKLGLSRKGEEMNLATPEAVVFVFREDLPGQASYLTFFSLGLLRMGEEALVQAAELFTSAIDSLTPLAEASTNPWEAYVWRGNVYSWLGEHDLAISDYNRCLELNPHTEGFFNRGTAYWHKGDYDAAIADCTKAIEIAPQYSEAYFGRGVAYGAKGDYDAAIADYNKAIEIAPQYAYVYVNRGVAYRRQGDYDAAIADYNKAIEIDPQYKNAYVCRGVVHGIKGDYDAAIADYNKAIEIDPQHKHAYFNRGNVYGAKGDYDAAIADYNKAIEIDPQYKHAYFSRGAAYGSNGDYDAAIDDYTEVIEIDPQYASAYYNRGLLHEQLGNHEAVIADFTEDLKLDPGNPGAHYHRGKAHRALGKTAEAIADFEAYLQLKPDADDRAEVEEWIRQLRNQ